MSSLVLLTYLKFSGFNAKDEVFVVRKQLNNTTIRINPFLKVNKRLFGLKSKSIIYYNIP